MAEDEVGGIRASITADASNFLSVLNRAEQAARSFDSRFGKINVQITATIQGLEAAERRLAALQRAQPAVTQPAARPATPATTAAVPAAAAAAQPGALPVATTRPTPPTTSPITRPAPPVTVAAQPVAAVQAPVIDEAANRASALARGAPGQRVQYQRADGGIGTALVPSRGGAAGGIGGPTIGGGVAIRAPGPEEFAGRARGGDPNINFQAMQEAAARSSGLIRENEELKQRLLDVLQPPAGSVTGRHGLRDPATGRFISVAAALGTQPVITRRQRGPQTIQRPPAVEAAAAEPEPLYVPPAGTGQVDQEELLAAVMGDLGPERQRQALGQLPGIPTRTRRRGGAQQITEPRAIRRRLSPQERAGAQAALAEQAAGLEGEVSLADVAGTLEEAESRLIRARQRTQVRALGTTLGGGITTLLGATEAKDIQLEANRALNEARYFQKALNEAKAVELSITERYNKENDPAKRTAIYADLVKQREVVEDLGENFTDAAASAEDLSRQADAAAKGGLRNISGAFAGALVGSIAFGVGMAAVTGVVSLVDKALGPVIERMTGYQNVSAKLTDTISDQSRQEHGLVDTVVAESLARSRLNAETAASIAPSLALRTSTEAANKAFSDQLDLFNASAAIQRQNAQFGGFDRGLFQTTGGLNILGVQTPLFGVPSTQELVGRQLQQANLGVLSGQNAGVGVGRPPLGGPGIPTQAERFADSIQVATDSVDYLNEQLEKGGETTLKFSANTEAASQAIVQAQVRTLQLAGAPEIASAIAQAGGRITLTGLPGGQAGIDAVRRGLQALQIANQREDPTLALTRLREQTIPARRFQLETQAAFQRDLLVAQTGVQRAAQPFLPFGTTVPGGIGAVSPGLQALIGPTGGIDRMRIQQVNAGRMQIDQIVTRAFGPAAGAAAVGQFNQIQQLGAQAAGISAAVTQQQVNLATNQYNEQLRQARLQLSDLAQLTGRIGATSGDNLGLAQKQVIAYERQNQQLQIQLSTLQLELQQRQINFQVAIAGFTAPGVTGAERAARIEQAELEASFAQRQLDIQKQILANQTQVIPLQIQIQDIQFQRDYITAANAINLLTEARQVTIDTAAASEKIAQINADIETSRAQLDTYLQAAASFTTQIISDAAQFLALYSESAATLEKSVEDFFSGITDGYTDAISRYLTRVTALIQRSYNQLTGGSGATAPAGGGGSSGLQPGYAQTGFYGQITRPTSLVVGEAGAETVAVLRNPREMPWGGGGGTQINLTVMVTGNTVRSDADLEALSTAVARKVEESLSRRTSLLGFRP